MKPSPTAALPALDRCVTSTVFATPKFGSSRDTVPSSPFAIQIAPDPLASPVGVAVNGYVRSSDSVSGPIRDRVRSSPLATQIDPKPAARLPGRMPVATELTLSDADR